MIEDLPRFPCFLRPKVGYSYEHNGQNINTSSVAGGSPVLSLMYRQNYVNFNVSFSVPVLEHMQIFNDFYFNTIRQGTKKFVMSLSASGPREDMVCTILPGSLSVVGSNPFQVSLTLQAEKISAPFNGDLYELSAAGYSNIYGYLDRINLFANKDLL